MAGWVQVGALVLLLAAVYRPFGDYLARVYSDSRHWRVERLLYRLARVDPQAEQRWPVYAAGVLGFSLVSVLVLYGLQRLQPALPLSFDRGAVEPAMAFNTAVSFVTNTNWQSYVPETTLGHTVQMAGLTVQNFASAAVGIAVAVALVRGFARTGLDRIGNVWVDVTRGVVRVLLPLAFAAAILMVALGATMSLASHLDASWIDGTSNQIAQAPVASQEAIKELGTNGGGVLNANSAHPFENPSPVSNLLQVFLLLLIPVCLTRAFGVMVGDRRQGFVLVGVMAAVWLAALSVTWWAESNPNGPVSFPP